MKLIDTAIPGVKIIEPAIFGDERGFFFESFNQARFNATLGGIINFVQDNHSHSTRGVLRGLHYQLAPHAQGKLVRCTCGEIFDVAVDIRPDSPTFGRHISVTLNAENKRQLWIPEGFAHGFLVLSDAAEVMYKTTQYYCQAAGVSIAWNDPSLKIDWPLQCNPILSEKDKNASRLSEIQSS